MAKSHIKAVECPKIWDGISEQFFQRGDMTIHVSVLISKAEHLVLYELPIYHMALPHLWLDECSMIQIVGHMKMIMDADLTKPIILDEDGYIMDGRHRLAKALYEGKKTILAVRFDKDTYS